MKKEERLLCMLRKAKIISLLIAKNAKITNRDNDGNSIYHFIDNKEVFESLREAMRNLDLSKLACIPNNKGELPIHTACREGCLYVLKQLVLLMNEQDRLIAKDNSFLTFKNKRNKTPLDIAFKYKKIDCIEYLHSQGAPNLLVEAVQEKDFDKVKELVKYGYHINSFNQNHETPLHAAAFIQSEEIIQYLICHGAEPKIQMLDGSLPVHFAANHNNIDICMLLFTEKFKISSIHSSIQACKYRCCIEELPRFSISLLEM